MPKSALSLAPASGVEGFKIPKKKRANTKKGTNKKKKGTKKPKPCPCKNGYNTCSKKICKNKIQNPYFESFAAPSSMPVSVTFGGTEEFAITRSRMRSGAPKRRASTEHHLKVKAYMKKHYYDKRRPSKVTGKMVYPKDAMIKASQAVAQGKH